MSAASPGTALERHLPPRSTTYQRRTANDNRSRARYLAEMTLARIEVVLRTEIVKPGDLIALYRELCDRAGFLTGRDLASAEASRWQVTATLLAAPGLSDAERSRILNDVRERERSTLAEYTMDARERSDAGLDEED